MERLSAVTTVPFLQTMITKGAAARLTKAGPDRSRSFTPQGSQPSHRDRTGRGGAFGWL
jgi:hypothetical protein